MDCWVVDNCCSVVGTSPRVGACQESQEWVAPALLNSDLRYPILLVTTVSPFVLFQVVVTSLLFLYPELSWALRFLKLNKGPGVVTSLAPRFTLDTILVYLGRIVTWTFDRDNLQLFLITLPTTQMLLNDHFRNFNFWGL